MQERLTCRDNRCRVRHFLSSVSARTIESAFPLWLDWTGGLVTPTPVRFRCLLPTPQFTLRCTFPHAAVGEVRNKTALIEVGHPGVTPRYSPFQVIPTDS